MIHGLSKYSTQGARAGLEYFMDEMFFDKDSETWQPRDPAPELLEGDMEIMTRLCESLDFKHKYTSGVISFTVEETALIDSQAGKKEQIIQDLKDFAFAGIDKDENRLIVVVEHRHTGRLELHYMIPRVHAESGKYFNPFPPNYDGKRGAGNNKSFIEHNDAFVDHMCEKYGLQNPRDPSIARSVKLPQFDPNKAVKKQVVDAIDQLVEAGAIAGRPDMLKFLENIGAEITRTGEDYFSFKFPGMQKAARLKGPLYSERSFKEIAERHESAIARFDAQRLTAGSRYASAIAERSGEVQHRHRIPTETAERAERLASVSSERLQQTFGELRELKRDIGNFAPDVRNNAREFVNQNPLIMTMPEGNLAAVGESCDPDSGAGAIQTGDPVIDDFARKMHAHWQRLLKESIAIMMRGIQERSLEYDRVSRSISKAIGDLFKVNLGIFTGRPAIFPLMKQDLRLCGQHLGEQIKSVRDDLNYLKHLEAQTERVDRRILSPLEVVEKARTGMSLPSDIRAISELATASKEARPLLYDLARKHQGDATLGE
jgi:hypothetical protein